MLHKVSSILNSKSVKVNYILNLTRVLSGALIGIVTMPYINKALGAEVLGKVEYVNTLITYFLMFSALGIPMYGIREISKVRDEPVLLARTTIELLSILVITTFFSYIALFGVIYQLDYFSNYRDLILMMSIMIFLTNIGAEWFFQGLENQLYITVRYVLVRIISLVIILLYIKSPSDYLLYALCLVITACGANIFNIYYLYKKTIKVEFDWKKVNVKRHFKPVLLIFLGTISVNIYLQLDYFLIGSLVGDKYVGYYAVSNKLIRFVIGFITIIGSVMLPKLSILYAANKEQYHVYLRKSLSFMLIFSVPFTVYFFVFAEPLIHLFAGKDFENAVVTMKILSPLCIIVSIAYFMGFLVLYPMGKEKVYTWAVVLSAVFSILINFFAISTYQQNGAAVVAVLSELIAIIAMYVFITRKNMLSNFFDNNVYQYFVAGALMLLTTVILKKLCVYDNTIFFVINTFFGFAIYFLFLIFVKEAIIMDIFSNLKSKFHNKA
ncbi:Membrane protein involved in the export of O-antigen and teichoic acid [Soonwooa buanensis]|uniref:Membrane protein involved in the export of O-antigen and teichoic acid n=1 Tax=Soonwooa buanensis TaxID=619805 RepID=A0A1T5EUD8_9FLAO|nr:flippase [Soonwooa buanensis]SKB87478.1 Membrane protein involved in the export of O-antigen and teichoic acid [Soonwooa buanensis]